MFTADHKLIIIIVKSVNICKNCTFRKSFWPAYSQLGMIGAIFFRGRGGTPLYWLYRYVLPQRVGFFGHFGHK